MALSIYEPVAVEMIRDGGSLSATFTSDHAKRYILLFRLRIRDLDAQKKEYLGFYPPVLIDTDPEKRPVGTDSIVYSELSGPSVPISWPEAREILEQVSRLIGDMGPYEERWLHGMIDAARFDGVPPGFPKTVQYLRPPPHDI
jgi:hypothetical protein